MYDSVVQRDVLSILYSAFRIWKADQSSWVSRRIPSGEAAVVTARFDVDACLNTADDDEAEQVRLVADDSADSDRRDMES